MSMTPPLRSRDASKPAPVAIGVRGNSAVLGGTRGPRGLSLSGTRRRSLGVAALKRLLPLIAGGLIALILAWPHLAPDDRRFRLEPVKVAPQDITALRMANPRYVGIDNQRRPFVVTASSATQSSAAADIVDLVEPKADMTMKSGAWATGSAEAGAFMRDTNLLDLIGSVSLFHDSGAELHTDRARIDLNTHDASGEYPTQGQSPSGTVEGEGFRVFDHGSRIIFTGKARAVLRNSQGRTS